jgi:oxygen-dependent protoporphyrinogen oxidase
LSSIIIVGGGVSGLVCGWRLWRAGHDVEVLECETEPGGRMRSESHGDFVLERGAQFITRGYRNLHSVARVLGILDRIRPLPVSKEAIAWNGRLEPADASAPLELVKSPLLSAGAKLRVPRLAAELFRHRSLLDPLQPELATSLDVEDAATYLARTVGTEARDRLIGPLVSGTYDLELEDLSAAALLLALRSFASGPQLETLEGGLGGFTQALASELPVRLGCRVVSVETETDGARVRYVSAGRLCSVVADAVVMAVPGSLVPGLCPKLTPTERGFFEGIEYVRGTIVHVLLERPATTPYFGVSFPRLQGNELYAVTFDHTKPGAVPEGAGLLNTALTQEASERLWDAPDKAVVELVLDQLLRAPLGPLAPAQAVVHRWPHMLPLQRTGSFVRLGAFLRRSDRSPRLAFAGDYLIGPSLEAALTSGMRAASELAQGLERPR